MFFDFSNPEKNDVIPGKPVYEEIHIRHVAEVKLLPNEEMLQTVSSLQFKGINDYINGNNESFGDTDLSLLLRTSSSAAPSQTVNKVDNVTAFVYKAV